MLSIIDADIVAFRVAACSEDETEAIVKYRIDDMMYRMLDTMQADNYLSLS